MAGGTPYLTQSNPWATGAVPLTPTYHMADYKIDYKRVSSVVKLDLDTDVKMFKTWELQAEDLFATGRPDVLKLLEYAAASGMPITKAFSH